MDARNTKNDSIYLSPICRTIERSLGEHLETIKALEEKSLDAIEKTGRIICEALAAGHKVMLCGNGGSAADAQHIAAELVGRYERARRAWPAVALTTDTSALTALANDFSYQEIFSRQVEALAKESDVLIAISTSGNSQNVLNAVEKATEIGCKTIALTGKGDNPLSSLCNLSVAVPSSRTSRIQEAHIIIGHLWSEMVDQMLS